MSRRRYALASLIAATAVSVAACDDASSPPSVPAPEQAVLIHVPAPDSPRDDIALADIEDPLIDVLAGSGAGELDGNEVSLQDGSAVIYLYGPDADRLFATIEPTLRKLPLPPGTYAVKQYGEPGARESRVPLR